MFFKVINLVHRYIKLSTNNNSANSFKYCKIIVLSIRVKKDTTLTNEYKHIIHRFLRRIETGKSLLKIAKNTSLWLKTKKQIIKAIEKL